MTKYGRPVLVAPASRTRAMLTWSIIASACRSASNRAMTWRQKLLAFVKPKDGPEAPAYAEQLRRLVQLYDAWGKMDEADRWRKELDGARRAPPKKVQQ